MKPSRFCLLALALTGPALAQSSHSTRGYIRNDGTYVAPSGATNPNGSRFDNYSTQGNINPYSGRVGTVNPYAAPSTPNPFVSPYGTTRSRR